jgi:hypothetical protein
MKGRTSSLFCLKADLATMSGVLFIVTLVWREWMELVFQINPDGGNGLLEWVIAAALFAAGIGFGCFAAFELRQPARAR